MTGYAAFLRAVNVGGTGKLPMADLRDLCAKAGFGDVKTYIASGNVALSFDGPEAAVKDRLEAALQDYAGKPVAVLVRTGAQLAAIIDANPYSDQAGNQVIAMLLDAPPDPAMLDAPKGLRDEQLALGTREIYAYFPQGMGQSRLQIPGAARGTARNMYTIAKMAALVPT